jgi:hypothetical protein
MHGEVGIYTKYWSRNLKGRDHVEDIGVGGKVIFEWILKQQVEKVWVDWMNLTQDSDQWSTLVHMVMNLQVS